MPLNIILDSLTCLTMVGSLRQGKGEYLSHAAAIGCLKILENLKLEGDVQGDLLHIFCLVNLSGIVNFQLIEYNGIMNEM